MSDLDRSVRITAAMGPLRRGWAGEPLVEHRAHLDFQLKPDPETPDEVGSFDLDQAHTAIVTLLESMGLRVAADRAIPALDGTTDPTDRPETENS